MEPLYNVKIAGDPSSWIGFFGSYIGGVLTAIIGFLTLQRTSKESNRQIQIAYQESVVSKLEETLADCVSLFDFSRLGVIAMFLDDESQYNRCLRDLDEYYSHVMTVANAWGVVYDGRKEKEIQDFQSIYTQCVKNLTESINQITNYIKSLKKEQDIAARNKIKEEIAAVLLKHIEYNKLLKQLSEKAQIWLTAERTKLEQLQQKSML